MMRGLSIKLILVTLFLAVAHGCKSTIDSSPGSSENPTDKELYEFDQLRALPSESDSGRLFLKAGHWFELRQPVKSNAPDQQVTLSLEAIAGSISQQPVPMPGIERPLIFERPTALVRGQQKELTCEFFCPPLPANLGDGGKLTSSAIRVALKTRALGTSLREEIFPISLLPPSQNMVVVLSQSRDRYQFMKSLSCFVWSSTERAEPDLITPFRTVLLSEAEAQNRLPSALRFATAMSHLVWTDANPDALTDAQIGTLVDWIHFGGTCIVSGPDAQAFVRHPAFAPLLPLNDIRNQILAPEKWHGFSEVWSILSKDEDFDEQFLEIPSRRAIPAITGSLHPEAEWNENCEEFVAVRQIGAGRVVMTTFPLAENTFIDWPSYGSFFNGALLNRPPRDWVKATGSSGELGFGELLFAGAYRGFEQNAIINRGVQLIVRDLGLPNRQDFAAAIASDGQAPAAAQNTTPTNGADTVVSDRLALGTKIRTNVGEFDPTTPLASDLRDDLIRSSRLRIPRIETIMRLLGIYLAILIPLNAFVFKFFGRVEWAWLAMPIVSIVSAFVFIGVVKIDVGFSRAQKVLNFIELPANYDRGHVTSFLSLTSALSDDYRVTYPQGDGVALPVDGRSSTLSPFGDATLRYSAGGADGSGLISFPILANSVSSFCGETVQSLKGRIDVRWKPSSKAEVEVDNQSDFELFDVGFIARDQSGQRWNGFIKRLAPQSQHSINLDVALTYLKVAAKSQAPIFETPWKKSLEALANFDKDQTDSDAIDPAFINKRVRRFQTTLQRIGEDYNLDRGEILMAGIAEGPLSHLKVTPPVEQSDELSMIVVRRAAKLKSDAKPDVSLPPKQKPATIDALEAEQAGTSTK